jgi:hypothetical protein
MRLLRIIDEIEVQRDVGATYREGELTHEEVMAQARESVTHNEHGLAYESLVALLETYGYSLSGPGAVALLELGLMFCYKTDREVDREFDHRS